LDERQLRSTKMTKQFLHLSAYPCERCEGPFVSGSLAVRESEISKESDLREVGCNLLVVLHKQSAAAARSVTRRFPAVEWEPSLTVESVETARRVEMGCASRE